MFSQKLLQNYHFFCKEQKYVLTLLVANPTVEDFCFAQEQYKNVWKKFQKS